MQQPVILFVLLLLAGCAHGGERMDRVAMTETAKADPWENTNRKVFRFNTEVDRIVLSPIADGYRAAVPRAARNGIRNAYDNLQEPTNLANAVAQGKIKSAFRALDRILINGVLGLGVADHATDMGLTEQPHDFGQTLAVWTVPSGPFVMLPFLGPSTARDSVGFFVDFLLDPVDYGKNRLLSAEERHLQLGTRIIDTRAGLQDQGEQLLRGSADPYATLRSAWQQLRRHQIFDGNLPPDPEEDELFHPEPDGAETSAGAGEAPAPDSQAFEERP
ncbi:MAG: VacJ family lipoprotein [Sandarakinorhabdus sp.]|nr:VacJ family lipoprotein [Sandarakinorhabdus sp.]